MARVRGWILRRLLKSALVFEREASGLYATLHGKLGDNAAAGIYHLIEEERLHQKLLEDIALGRVPDDALEEILAAHRFHALEEIEPVDRATREAYGPTLEQALHDEEATVAFYANLALVSKIPVVKHAFRVLADMEREHVAILKRLLEAPSAPE